MEDVQQGLDAYRGERVRLAMWRLDTLAATLVGVEDQRGVEDFDRPELKGGSVSEVEEVNPLFNGAPDSVNAYWSAGDGKLESPQVYGEEKVEGEARKFNNRNLENFQEVKRIMSNKLDTALKGEVPLCDTNLDLSCAIAHLSVGGLMPVQKPVIPKVGVNDLVKGKGETKMKMKNAPGVQQKFSDLERQRRDVAVQRLSDNYSSNRANAAELKEDVKGDKILAVGGFKPVWLDGELMLVRKVRRASGDVVQGVWLNKAVIRRKLLVEIADLFPGAILVPVIQDLDRMLAGEMVEGDDETMLKLPFRLVPGEREVADLGLRDVMKGTVGLAWVGVCLALLAGFFVLKAVIEMSERRASFVSSVTHELRTPLTTFRLYTDMLTSGLMKDEVKKREYLDTLQLESERLTHLVENVLAYSGIERGSARTRMEEVRIGDVMSGMRCRLEGRAGEEGMEIVYAISEEDESVRVDVTGLEQIVFNLVDNASKYASGDGCGERVTVEAGLRGGEFVLRVMDEGRGISKRDRKRLFRAFHKSSEEAAVTKPGVGLGLSLCRKLARAMGGELRLVGGREGCGACFEFRLGQKK